MEPNCSGFSNFINGFEVNNETFVYSSNEHPNNEIGFNFTIPSADINWLDIHPSPSHLNPGTLAASSTVGSDGSSSALSAGWNPEGEFLSPLNDSDSSDPVLKYISHMLMEDNVEENPCMIYNPSALQATEKSFSDVLSEQHPRHAPPFNQPQLCVNVNSESLDRNNNISNSGSDFSSQIGARISNSNSDPVGIPLVPDIRENNNPSLLQDPSAGDYGLQSNSLQPSSLFSVTQTESITSIGHGLMSSVDVPAQNMFSDSEVVQQFKRGLEEARKFLPSANQVNINLESYGFSKEQKEGTSEVVKVKKIERENSTEGSRGRKNHEREHVDLEEERRNKQSAAYVEMDELPDMFDRVLLLQTDQDGKPLVCTSEDHVEALQTGSSNSLKQNRQSNASNRGRSRASRLEKKKEIVDLETLLNLCAQAVFNDDYRTANELLREIRQHSSPSGDWSQRLAYFFANALEARRAGSGAGIKGYLISLAALKIADILKLYKFCLSASPFSMFAILFANKMIMNVAVKATTIHIVDFGIAYGFQWPILINLLSKRPGGPPKLRITGIELPQSGFKPTKRSDETGRRLAMYCERFNVPFEYNCMTSDNWETIQIEDLKIDTSEILAVNCLFRFNKLLDETDEVNCPRDAVLNLIRKINPAVFVDSICNGSYNSAFFLTRFREAIFYFSSLFDIFDNTTPREDPERSLFERAIYGSEIMNVVACDGLERIERPETHKQWQIRITRAGFKQLPLEPKLIEELRSKLKDWYHKDFLIDEDSNWMLQGWKGRIMHASSCWVPA